MSDIKPAQGKAFDVAILGSGVAGSMLAAILARNGVDTLLVDADEILLNFLSLLIENHRMPVLFRIRDEYERLWEEEHKTLPVEITSAIALDEQTTASLGETIGQRAGRNVTLATRVDPDIIGGIIVRVGNSILDASIRNRLEQLRRHVAQGAS